MKVEEYKIKDWEHTERGLLIVENEEWLLVKHIPVDYVIDGYKLYKKVGLEKRSRTGEEEQIEKVLRLKGIEQDLPKGFQFTNTLGLLDWVEKTYGLFEFQDQDETELFYGKKNHVKGHALVIDMIKADGSVEPKYDFAFDLKEIRIITFETDYHQSMQLLYKDGQGDGIPHKIGDLS